MAPLPKFRMTPGRPAFLSFGVDFLGLFLTKNDRSVTKRYLCIFTCMAIRAVHLEVVFGLETDSYWQAFFRFTSRHVSPDMVCSERVGNFVGAEFELRQAMRRRTSDDTFSKLAKKHVK